MISEELVALIYGSIVIQVIDNSQHLTQVNARLQKIGQRIGTKLVDQFFRDARQKPCQKIKQLVDKFCTIGVLKFFPNMSLKCQEYKQTQKGCNFNLKLINNPLLFNIQIPSELKNGNLQYQSIIKGAFKGVFEALKMQTTIITIYEDFRHQKKNERNTTIYNIDLLKQ